MLTVDLNCDMGEGYGEDAQIMPFISSANIACGYHAGDEQTMRQTIDLAIAHGVQIGAHPSFPDRKNFGRMNIAMSPDKVYQMVAHQIDILQSLAALRQGVVHHVKPHGALYNQAATDNILADAICRAIKDADARLTVYGLSGSILLKSAAAAGLACCSEVFADRGYAADGSLLPRDKPGAVIESVHSSCARVIQMIEHGHVDAADGTSISLLADTVCIHGDGKNAAAVAREIHQALTASGIAIRAPGIKD